jgi:DNA-binding transcriptional LysR family regulator
MNPRFLETFILVARLRSFSLAAERLYTTQANVSARIASLEKELGVPLLMRQHCGVCLTPQGIIALEEAQNVVCALDDFRGKVCGENQMAGHVILGVIDSIATSVVPLFIEYLRINHPRVTLELRANTSLNLSKSLLDGDIHLALLMGPVSGCSMVNLDLINLACTWVCSLDFDLPARVIDVTELASYPIISFPPDSIPYAAMRNYFRREVFQNISITTSNSIATIIDLVKRRMGVAVLPKVVVEDDIMAGRLRRLDTLQKFPSLAIHAAYKASDNPLIATLAKGACKVAANYCATRSFDVVNGGRNPRKSGGEAQEPAGFDRVDCKKREDGPFSPGFRCE